MSCVRGGGVFRVPPPLWCRLELSGGGLCGWAAAVVAGRAMGPSGCAAALCGVVPLLWARFLPFRAVRRLARVRPTVSVPCFGVVVCIGAPCCVVPCFAVLRRAGLCCVVVCSALSCRVAPCRAMVHRAVPRRAVSCCGVSCRRFLVVVRCTAVRCGAVCRVASCCAVYPCALGCGGPFSLPLRRGAGSALVRLARFVVRDAGRGYVAGSWLGGSVRCGVAR